MSSQRLHILFILTFWSASMGWLTWTKLRPAAQPNQVPKSGDVLPVDAGKLEPIAWQILLNGHPLGWARQDIERSINGQGTVRSTVHLEDLSIDQVVRQGMGNMAVLLTRGLGQQIGNLTLTIQNTMRFDHFGQLEVFRSIVSEKELGKFIRLQGTVYDGELVVKAYLSIGATKSEREPIKEFRLPLPDDKLLTDRLSPRPQFSNLRVGQRWSFESYNPLSPTQPMQTIDAHVIGKEVIQQWGESERTFHVVYQRAANDGLSIEQSLGDVWVRPDGTVIRQQLTWGTLTLTFDRLLQAEDINTRDFLLQPVDAVP